MMSQRNAIIDLSRFALHSEEDGGEIKRSTGDIEFKLKVIKGKLKVLALCVNNKSPVALYKSQRKLSNQFYDEVQRRTASV
jgi:hypothetical protein